MAPQWSPSSAQGSCSTFFCLCPLPAFFRFSRFTTPGLDTFPSRRSAGNCRSPENGKSSFSTKASNSSHAIPCLYRPSPIMKTVFSRKDQTGLDLLPLKHGRHPAVHLRRTLLSDEFSRSDSSCPQMTDEGRICQEYSCRNPKPIHCRMIVLPISGYCSWNIVPGLLKVQVHQFLVLIFPNHGRKVSSSKSQAVHLQRNYFPSVSARQCEPYFPIPVIKGTYPVKIHSAPASQTQDRIHPGSQTCYGFHPHFRIGKTH